MAREPSGRLIWDLEEISRALKLTPADVRAYFTDGRRVSFILERRIAYEIIKGRLAPSEGAGYDLIDAHAKNGRSGVLLQVASNSAQVIWSAQVALLMRLDF